MRRRVISHDVIERLKEAMIKLGLNGSSLEQMTGLNNINKVLREEMTLTSRTRDYIDKFTDINMDYVMTGIGEPLKRKEDETKGMKNVPLKPRILNYANAGLPTDALEQNVDDYMPVIKQLPNYDCTIVIRGDSMEPTYHSGDEIAVKDITGSGFRQWGTPHVLNTAQGVLIKRIFPDEEGKGYKCVSDNKSYAPFVVPEHEVYNVYKIVGLVRIEG